jgi:peroxiredoxin (alkyl hydroperoxide reductase subunit C)
MIFEYPVFVGRNTDEVLRVAKALQLRDRTGAATPADWYDGDIAIISDNRPEADVIREFGVGSTQLRPYLRVVGQCP